MSILRNSLRRKAIPRVLCFHTLPPNSRRVYSTDNSSGEIKLFQALQSIKTHYPDRDRLHARIDNYIKLFQTGKVRIGIIPFQSHRTEINGVLEAILADPLATDQSWYEALKNRALSKDTLISFSPTFDNQVLAHNSLIEYQIPFRETSEFSKTTEIMEVNSAQDSQQHLDSCHFHVYASSNIHAALTTPIPGHFPRILAIDVPAVTNELLIEQQKQQPNLDTNKADSGVVLISSKAANEAVDLLAQSPANISKSTNLREQSQFGKLEQTIFTDPRVIEQRLLNSIIYSCEQFVAPSSGDELAKTVEQESDAMRNLRSKWSREAHEELQGRLFKGLDNWAKRTVPWYKLYFRVDDIYDSLSDVLHRDFLIESNAKLEYLLGRIDSFAARHNFPDALQTSFSTSSGLSPELVYSETIPAARSRLIETSAVDVHNDGLKKLATVLFGMQLPTFLVSCFGMYFYDYSLYSMGSIMGLGVVLGFRALQKSWQSSTERLKTEVLEEARKAISECEFLIWKRWEAKVLDGQESISKQIGILEEVKTEMGNEYSRDEK